MKHHPSNTSSGTRCRDRREFLRDGLFGLGGVAALPLLAPAGNAEPVGNTKPTRAPRMKITGLEVEVYESAVREPAYRRWQIWTGRICNCRTLNVPATGLPPCPRPFAPMRTG